MTSCISVWHIQVCFCFSFVVALNKNASYAYIFRWQWQLHKQLAINICHKVGAERWPGAVPWALLFEFSLTQMWFNCYMLFPSFIPHSWKQRNLSHMRPTAWHGIYIKLYVFSDGDPPSIASICPSSCATHCHPAVNVLRVCLLDAWH